MSNFVQVALDIDNYPLLTTLAQTTFFIADSDMFRDNNVFHFITISMEFLGQARIDGAICDHTLEDKIEYLKAAYDAGVRNIEMEGTCLAAMCHKSGIKGWEIPSFEFSLNLTRITRSLHH